MKLIRNGKAYPKSLKLAALKASQNASASTSVVAREFNIGKSTLVTWRRQAKIAAALPAGLAAHQKAAAATKAYNTPIINPNGTITYRGKTFKA